MGSPSAHRLRNALPALSAGAFAVCLALAGGCSNGENALYDPDRTIPIELAIELAPVDSEEPLEPDRSGPTASYSVFAPCTLRLRPQVTSSLDGELRVWNAEALTEQLGGRYEWWLDSLRNYGFSPALVFLEPDTARALFRFVDAKGDTLADSLVVYALPRGGAT